MDNKSEGFESENMPKRRLKAYFGFILFISIPIWIINPLSTQFIPEGLPMNQIGFVLVFAPLTVAYILLKRDNGKEKAKELLKKAVDYKGIENKIWYLPILFVIPMVFLLSLGLMMLLKIPFFENSVQLGMIPIMLLVMIIFAIGEEFGWQEYAFNAMKTKWNNLKAAILLGLFWGFWHIPLYLVQDPPGGFLWIAGQCFYTVALRLLIVWIYNNTNKCLFSAVLIHAISNLSGTIFPILNSPYGAFIAGVILVIIIGIGISFRRLEGKPDNKIPIKY